jgi:hypothetical protein
MPERVEKCIKILVGIPEGKRPRGGIKRSCEDNIRMDLREKVWEYVDWIHLAQDSDLWRAHAYTVMNLSVP